MSDDVVQFFGVMMTLLVTGVLGYAGFTVVGALQRRLGSRSDPVLAPDEVEAVRANIEETDQLRHRVAELEERLDFAERLLAKSEPARLSPGNDCPP
ncbi:MAG: hypothetical protein FJ206_14925 [Gemmatimonadetes bacterium]|nr:hypothetical protein [Gemmatimonadota bacterium]